MGKLVLMSVVIALVALPMFAANDPNPVRGVKRAMASVIAFNLFYVFIVRVIVPRLG